MEPFAPEACHEHLYEVVPRSLGFDPKRDFAAWRQDVETKLRELIGVLPERVPLNIRKEYERENETFRETRFLFSAEARADVPCHLLVPQNGQAPFPVVICLQGHTTGMHISLGRQRSRATRRASPETVILPYRPSVRGMPPWLWNSAVLANAKTVARRSAHSRDTRATMQR